MTFSWEIYLQQSKQDLQPNQLCLVNERAKIWYKQYRHYWWSGYQKLCEEWRTLPIIFHFIFIFIRLSFESSVPKQLFDCLLVEFPDVPINISTLAFMFNGINEAFKSRKSFYLTTPKSPFWYSGGIALIYLNSKRGEGAEGREHHDPSSSSRFLHPERIQ